MRILGVLESYGHKKKTPNFLNDVVFNKGCLDLESDCRADIHSKYTMRWKTDGDSEESEGKREVENRKGHRENSFPFLELFRITQWNIFLLNQL